MRSRSRPRPGAAQAETGDVFDLEAYLVGAQVETSLSFDEMLLNPDLENQYVVTWADYGPLADVMFPDGRPERRVVTISLSLLDLAGLYLGGSEAEDVSLAKITGPGFDENGIVNAVETVTTVYERERQDGERFVDTYRRIGMNPFKEALYG